jgi:peptidyl-prolyl cis-trans isomerase C
MAYKADELGYDKEPSVVQGMESFTKMGLQAAYLKRAILDKVKVTDEEVQNHYRNQGATLSIKQILIDTPDETERVHQMILDGADFESVCREYSKGPDAEEGGRVQTVSYGSFAPEFQNAIFNIGVGDVADPLITPYGWFIIKVLRRAEARNKESFE